MRKRRKHSDDIPFSELGEAYLSQLKNARERGIEFRLTFPEWLEIWIRSRRLHLRGRGKGKYCMSRKEDKGAYEVGNVKINLNKTNTQDALTGKPLLESTKIKMGRTLKGRQPRGVGWHHSKKTRNKMSESGKRKPPYSKLTLFRMKRAARLREKRKKEHLLLSQTVIQG